MLTFETLWNFLQCKYRRKTSLAENSDPDGEDAFLLEDDPDCAVLSDQQIISQILAVSSNPQAEP
jgi:hypothetical protein